MEYRELGNTGIKLPVIGLGTWQYRGGDLPIQIGAAMGAGFIDTAESYGTEEVVGQAIRGMRKEVFVATKVSPRHFGYSDVIRSANESLRRLKTDYIDLYQLHWPNHTVPIEETMGAMESLVDCGKIRFIGVCAFMLRDLRNAQKAMTKYRIVSDQVRYNLIDRTIESGLLSHCLEHDITVIAHSPFSTSLSSLRARDPQDILGRLSEAKGKTVAQVALNWCISRGDVVAIPKSDSGAHVKENCAAADFQLFPDELTALDLNIQFRRRSTGEIELRRFARRVLQMAGKAQ
jgi:diketogulonate reductase-like aldo/keto reductase